MCAAFSTGSFSRLFEFCPKQRPLMCQQGPISELLPQFWRSLSSLHWNKPRPFGGTRLLTARTALTLCSHRSQHRPALISDVFHGSSSSQRESSAGRRERAALCLERGCLHSDKGALSLQSTGSCGIYRL